jgi:uncharacterized protein YciI
VGIIIIVLFIQCFFENFKLQIMKTLLTFCFLVILSQHTIAQTISSSYNAELADSLGADDYGMKSYILVILKTGNQTEPDDEKRNSLFRGHLDNIKRLTESGKMVVAGPLGKNDLNYRGIFILDTTNLEEAKELLATDPAIVSGLLAFDVIPWYGSAALSTYLVTHQLIEKMQP